MSIYIIVPPFRFSVYRPMLRLRLSGLLRLLNLEEEKRDLDKKLSEVEAEKSRLLSRILD